VKKRILDVFSRSAKQNHGEGGKLFMHLEITGIKMLYAKFSCSQQSVFLQGIHNQKLYSSALQNLTGLTPIPSCRRAGSLINHAENKHTQPDDQAAG